MAETKKPSHAQKAAGAKRKAGAEKKDKSTPKPEKNGGEPKFRLPIRFITSCSFLLAFIVSTIMPRQTTLIRLYHARRKPRTQSA